MYGFAIAVFLLHFLIVKKAVYGDGRYYYAYLPTILNTHTLNFSQSFHHLGIVSYQTPLHYPANKYSIGSAIAWSIPFIAINILLSFFHHNDGYNTIYQLAIGIWSITFVFTGIYFLKKTLELFFNNSVAVLVCLFIFFGTNLLFYGAVDVINSHSASFFSASLFVYFWLKEKTNKNAVISGFFLGFLSLIRVQDIVFIILPLTTFFLKRKSNLRYFFLVVITTLVTYFPQLLIWHFLWGTWYVNPYLFHESFNFFQPNIPGVLFNARSGLFLWTPIIILCLTGLIAFAKENKKTGIPLLLLFLTELYVVSSWSIWWQGASYSGRMFVSSLPLFAIGLGYLLSMKKFQKIVTVASFFFCVLNPLLIILFLKYIK